ncbi:hypothetical protein Cni_G02215 [Canna indica]|uniref:Uncharacterized protein n=1 Tax=Canna indica TaxID=4628 RepID=A0AAQ3Q2I2_9LILI|nr:hypothetical protein Cni_G02215 [Canna indica]
MGRDIHQAGYYLNPAYLYKYDLRTKDSLLFALCKVIQRMSTTNLEAAQAISESRYFQDESDNFGDSFAISCRDKMDPAAQLPLIRPIREQPKSRRTTKVYYKRVKDCRQPKSRGGPTSLQYDE